MTREQIEAIWDLMAERDMAYERLSMYYDEGADSEFCEAKRQRIVEFVAALDAIRSS